MVLRSCGIWIIEEIVLIKVLVSNVLGVYYDSDDADSYSVTGEGELAGMNLSFEFGSGSPYHVEYPDVISSSHSVVAGMEQEE